MLQLSKSDYEELLKILNLSISDTYSELEAVFKPRKNNQPFTRNNFEDMFRRLQNLGLKNKEEPEQLDITVREGDKGYSNSRITLNSVGVVKEYCQSNSIDGIKNQYISFIKKNRYSFKSSEHSKRQRVKPLYMNDYNFKINLNHEHNCRKKEIEEIKKDFTKKNKTFRLKKRYSFESKDGLFRFDLSIIKTSKKKS